MIKNLKKALCESVIETFVHHENGVSKPKIEVKSLHVQDLIVSADRAYRGGGVYGWSSEHNAR